MKNEFFKNILLPLNLLLQAINTKVIEKVSTTLSDKVALHTLSEKTAYLGMRT